MKPRMSGPEMILNERARQIEDEGRSLAYDLENNERGELAAAASCYALLAAGQSKAERMPGGTPDVVTMAPLKAWPWRGAAWNPSNNRLKNLVRAGALIAAEIDRLTAQGERLPERATPPVQPAAGAAAALDLQVNV